MHTSANGVVSIVLPMLGAGLVLLSEAPSEGIDSSPTLVTLGPAFSPSSGVSVQESEGIFHSPMPPQDKSVQSTAL